jgi:hypothetical protein
MKQRLALLTLLVSALILGACGATPAAQRALDFPSEALGGAAPAPEMISASEAPVSLDQAVYSGEPIPQDRMVIRNANLTLVVKDPTASVDTISRLAEEMGGFVVSSTSTRRPTATPISPPPRER